MNDNLPPSHPYFRVSPRILLLIILLISITSVSSAVSWIYHRVHRSFGMQAAEVSVALLAILVLGLIMVGVRLGFSTKSALRRRHDHAERIYCLFNRSRTFQEFWFFLGLGSQPMELASEIIPLQELCAAPGEDTEEDDLSWLLIMEEEIIRRGRTPDHSTERWARVIYAWEHQDPWNRITLNEFLCQEFGACGEGLPMVSRSTFYAWRRKIHRLAREYRVKKKLPHRTGNS